VKLLVGLVSSLVGPLKLSVGLVKLLVGLVSSLVGLVKLLVGLAKLLVGLGLAPAEPSEPDAGDSPPGDAALAVVGVRPAAVGSVIGPEPAVPEAAAPEPVGLFTEPDVGGLAALDGAVAPLAPPLVAPPVVPAGAGAPSDIWITAIGPVEKVPDPVALTPLPPSTSYLRR